MLIKLMSDWFSPDGSLLRKGEHEVPDDWAVPSTAKVLKEEPKPKPETKKA
jgi:hypothetical protein